MPYKPTNQNVRIVKAQADVLVTSHLKPEHIKPVQDDPQWPYLIDIQTGWRGNYFYFTGIYQDPRPDTPEPVFKQHFARLTALGHDSFVVSYMRHTGNFCEICPGVPLLDALEMIKDLPIFDP